MGEQNFLADNLRRGWKARSFASLRDLAVKAEVNYDTVRSMERGLVQNGRSDTLEPLARLLGTTADKLRSERVDFLSDASPERGIEINPEVVRDLLDSSENRKMLGLWIGMDGATKSAVLDIMVAVSRLALSNNRQHNDLSHGNP